MNPDQPIMAIAPSPGRRWMGIATLVALGVILFRIALGGGGNPLLSIIFLLVACASFWAAYRLHGATSEAIELTENELRLSGGMVLTSIENIRAVERGAFAFKPSNGFLVRLADSQKTSWSPGLYWRRGKLLGIGGTIPGGQSRAMADTISAMLLER